MAIVEEVQEAVGLAENIGPMWEYLTPELLKSLGPQQIGRTPKAETESVSVTYKVLSVERVSGAGRLVGVAHCEVEIAGVVTVLQGVQVRRGADGSLSCTPPRWRHPRTGQWLPAVILPQELAAALAEEVLEAACGAEQHRTLTKHAALAMPQLAPVRCCALGSPG